MLDRLGRKWRAFGSVARRMLPSRRCARVEFEAGQIWEYRTESGFENTRLIIVKIDTFEGHRIIHVFVADLAPGNQTTILEFGTPFLHMPFIESMVEGSVTELVGRVETLPDLDEGYQNWRNSFQEQGVGVWTGLVGITVARVSRHLIEQGVRIDASTHMVHPISVTN